MIANTSKSLCLVLIVVFASFAACGSGTESTAGAITIAGHWSQDTGSDKKGMTLQFDADSDKLMVHTAPSEDGAHDHLSGTYAIDQKSGAVTVQCELNGEGKGASWQGKLEGEHLTLTAGSDTLRFHHGDDPHEHK